MNKQIATPDSSRLALRESQLRNHHIANWMRTTRSRKELLELCLDHFYRDQPKLLGWGLAILDGDSKDAVLARILREGRATPLQAETFYQQIQGTIALSQKLVEQSGTTESGHPGFHRPAANAGVVTLGYSEESDFALVVRPTAITACAVLLFLSAAVTTLLVAGNFAGTILEQAGGAGVFFSVALTAVCGWGYLTMKRWAVLLYAIEPICRFWMGMSHMMIAIPVMIVAFGLMHFREMTWK